MPLSNGIKSKAVVPSDDFSVKGLNQTRICRNSRFQKLGKIKFPDKANPLTVLFVGCRQTEFPCRFANTSSLLLLSTSGLGLKIIAYRKQTILQLLLSQSPQKITLIFILIFGLQKFIV